MTFVELCNSRTEMRNSLLDCCFIAPEMTDIVGNYLKASLMHFLLETTPSILHRLLLLLALNIKFKLNAFKTTNLKEKF